MIFLLACASWFVCGYYIGQARCKKRVWEIHGETLANLDIYFRTLGEPTEENILPMFMGITEQYSQQVQVLTDRTLKI